MKTIFTLALILLTPFIHFSQYCESFELNLEGELMTDCFNNTQNALHDQLGRNYLYLTQSEGGIGVVDLSEPTDMSLITSVSASEFSDLSVSNISQDGNYLYVAIGRAFGAHDQPSGLAIVDVTLPEAPAVLDVWTTVEDGGATSVTIVGNKAYLCGLSNGLIVLDITDPTEIGFIGDFMPATDWPADTDEEKINVRNVVVDGDVGYVAFDAGGMRIIDISDPTAMEEIGRYSNPAMDGAARAYNNIIKRGNLLYIAVDYAGMEILNIADFDDVTLTGWWNPNEFPLINPAATSLRWFSSEFHTNEIHLIDDCNIIFMSCGRTEIAGVDVSDPSNPELCGTFGDPEDDLSSYGMTVYGDRVYVGMVCVPFGIPFPGVWSGVKSLIYDSACPLGIEDESIVEVGIYPNPTKGELHLQFAIGNQLQHLQITDLTGKVVFNDYSGKQNLSIGTLVPGIYLVQLKTTDFTVSRKLMVE